MMGFVDQITLIRDTVAGIGAQVGPTVQQSAQETGVADIPGWFHLELATNIVPEPLTVERIRSRAAYSAPERIQMRLDKLAEGGWLKTEDGKNYAITEKGHTAMHKILDDQRAALSKLKPLSDEGIHRAIGLLTRVVEASIQAAQPASKQCLVDASRWQLPAESPSFERYFYLVDCLTAFRDDAHLAAWGSLGVDGHTWEIFSYIWEGKATSLETMPEGLLQGRGYTPEQDQAALQSLVKHGWLESTDNGNYRVTPAGKTVRDDAERRTDEYFYAPWSCLNDAEVTELRALLEEIKFGLQPVAA
jgi:DNA-binding PadR family transcriptional regulator